ncbi:MAG: DNA-protecting protein DprA [Deltaproteobacteria bacterium]|nr:DNA-protecting protein DprA [Deltaproteobacteria bacterium]
MELPERQRHPDLGPTELYCHGDASLLGSQAIAIVGSRDASPDARHFAGILARSAAHAGLVIVSGGARGIDFAAHDAALRIDYGRLICVLGSPLDRISPEISARLCERIVERGGVIVSEHPPGTRTYKGHFLDRNRIVAALADVTVVAAARLRSGSLHTARWAARLGKPVWAVPGPPWDTRLQGGNALIASWQASPLVSVFDFVTAMRTMFGRDPSVFAPRRDPIATLLAERAHSADELCTALELPPERLPLAIYEHLRSGRIVRGADGKYRLVEG